MSNADYGHRDRILCYKQNAQRFFFSIRRVSATRLLANVFTMQIGNEHMLQFFTSTTLNCVIVCFVYFCVARESHLISLFGISILIKLWKKRRKSYQHFIIRMSTKLLKLTIWIVTIGQSLNV